MARIIWNAATKSPEDHYERIGVLKIAKAEAEAAKDGKAVAEIDKRIATAVANLEAAKMG